MLSLDKMRTECVRYYVDKGYSLEHSEAYIHNDPDEILRVYTHIQEEKERSYFPSLNPFSHLFDDETTAKWAVVFFLSKSEGEREQKFLGKTGFLIGK